MKPVFFILFLLYFNSGAAQCGGSPVSVGPNNGSTFANDASTGTQAWSGLLTNAQLSDNLPTTVAVNLGIFSSATSNYLVVTNLGFSLPLYATVCGIKVDVERSVTGLGLGGSVVDNSVMIVKGGVISGNNLASGSAWPSSDAYTSYGGSTNKWGLTWTRDDINSANFGVAISTTTSTGLLALLLTAQIDHIRITVYYTPVPVPVKFHSFTAGAEADKIKLQWSTSYEYNSHYFVAEKSAEGSGKWISVDTVNSHQNSVALNTYYAVDHFPKAENLYRIKEVGEGGAVQYSESVAVSYKASLHAVVLTYPNPVINKLFVETKSIIEQITLTDNYGKTLFRQKPISSQLQISAGDLKPGIYFLRVQTKEGTTVEKIIKQ